VRDTDTGPDARACGDEEGQGLRAGGSLSDKFHGVSKFNVLTGEQKKGASGPPSYTKVFAEASSRKRSATKRSSPSRRHAIGTGLDLFAKRFPKRFLRRGHCRTARRDFAADSPPRVSPFAAIYSTFLQRAYDQVVHDVAIQSLPFALPSTARACRCRWAHACGRIRRRVFGDASRLRGDGGGR
jgi:1-deoxy-D-xylulose-5-phosphate synthase